MRESIGGSWLLGIVVVFIFFFSAFLAYSISYTRAFNVKNKIIDIIEENEGYNEGDSNDTAEGKINGYINQISYNTSIQSRTCNSLNIEGDMKNGFCLVKYCTGSGNIMSRTRYKVTTFISFEMPIIGVLRIPITGETREIFHDMYGYKCSG